MEPNTMILAKDQFYSLNCYQTKVNNNVLVVGTSGAGKTRSIVTPNLLQASGSYIVSDPKGNLYTQYKDYLEGQGYVVKKLDFTDPENSVHYNFFNYIHSTLDIVKIAHMIVYNTEERRAPDPFWDESSQLLIQAVIAYLCEAWGPAEQNLGRLLQLVTTAGYGADLEVSKTALDRMLEDWEEDNPDSYAVKTYKKFRLAANRTMRSTMVSINARLGTYDVPEVEELMSSDDIDIPSIGKKKTALFVVVSDTDRSMDGLVNIFFTQAMSELCRYADKECKNYCLPVPVRFILDDFATNCRIDDFPRMIASIRSRGISTMLMVQSEAQLAAGYAEDAKTIIGNCDTYVYLGGNDIDTAKAVAERCDIPVKKVLNMPVGSNWIFRRGEKPVNGENFDLEVMLREKKLLGEDR